MKLKNIKDKLGTALIINVMLLLFIGVATIASVSYPYAMLNNAPANSYLIKQSTWAVLGIIMFFLASKINYKKYTNEVTFVIYLAVTVLLILTLLNGERDNGAVRWLRLGNTSIKLQGSEFSKLSLILILSRIIANFKKRGLPFNFKRMGILTAFFFIHALLIIAGRAFTNTSQIVIIYLTLIFMGGLDIVVFISMILGFAGLGATYIKFGAEYRRNRFGITDQAKESMIAISNGKFFGMGYGQGYQKHLFLSEIHTDYIFSGYLEEMGFLGGIFLIGLYFSLLLIIIIAILKVKDYFAKLILSGIFIMLGTQITVNMLVTLNVVPSTGIPLPLLTYGGSGTLMTMISLGIVYNIIKSIDN